MLEGAGAGCIGAARDTVEGVTDLGAIGLCPAAIMLFEIGW
jgi:hypothetical protein